MGHFDLLLRRHHVRGRSGRDGIPLRVVHVHVRQLRAQRRQRGARRALRGHR